jgi:hypothetical protein
VGSAASVGATKILYPESAPGTDDQLKVGVVAIPVALFDGKVRVGGGRSLEDEELANIGPLIASSSNQLPANKALDGVFCPAQEPVPVVPLLQY